METTTEINRLQKLTQDLGINGVSITLGRHLGFGKNAIIVDADGDQEEFVCAEDAEAELRNWAS